MKFKSLIVEGRRSVPITEQEVSVLLLKNCRRNFLAGPRLSFIYAHQLILQKILRKPIERSILDNYKRLIHETDTAMNIARKNQIQTDDYFAGSTAKFFNYMMQFKDAIAYFSTILNPKEFKRTNSLSSITPKKAIYTSNEIYFSGKALMIRIDEYEDLYKKFIKS